MKVLLTATVQSHIVQFHKPLVEMLHAHGYEVHVAARNNLAEKNGLKLDFVEKVYDVPFSRSPKSTDNIIAYKELKKIIEIEKYDIIHCNTPMGGIITRLASIGARKRGAKVIYTAHGFHFYKGAPKKNWLLYYPIEKLFACMTDAVITINQEDYNFAKSKFHTKVYHIHGAGVDEKRFHPVSESESIIIREKLSIPEGRVVLLCVGELLPNKNQIMAIKAVQKLCFKYPNLLLLIAGNGKMKQYLDEYISNNNLNENVRLLGYKTNLEEYQRITDIGISCSIREGLGFNIIEAMLSQNAVIATANRGHNELIKNGENGFIVSIGDVDYLATKIEELVLDHGKRSHMGHCGNEYAQLYTMCNVVQELKDIYEDIKK